MPHAETDLAIPWAIVSILLFFTGAYGLYAVTKVCQESKKATTGPVFNWAFHFVVQNQDLEDSLNGLSFIFFRVTLGTIASSFPPRGDSS